MAGACGRIRGPRRNVAFPCPPKPLKEREKHNSEPNRAETEAARRTPKDRGCFQRQAQARGCSRSCWLCPWRFKIPDPAK